jgi:hypothetical protein
MKNTNVKTSKLAYIKAQVKDNSLINATDEKPDTLQKAVAATAVKSYKMHPLMYWASPHFFFNIQVK